EALNREGTQVATVGRIRAMPGAPNVIPGEVVLSLEIRDLAEEVITEMYAKITARAEAIAVDSGITISFEHLDTTAKPAPTDARIQALVEAEAGARGYSSKRMKSGAGHDTQDMALIAPAGMVFVPSRGGISHAPDEYTSPEAIARGANVLLGTLLRLDREWD
ncbi:MAG TPA: M20/M25/M40 family metallo-hydrolase, partial [Robiginitalea sp.]|nr:M20/M25/M40 family metallo-hydrolase [Robiginitalea sp.]